MRLLVSMKVGASITDIGTIGFIRTAGVILNPVYGYIQDTYSGYYAMVISAFCCAFGCLVRGIATDTDGLFVAAGILGLGAANLWTVVLAHVASNTSTQQRSLVVSGYLFQVSALSVSNSYVRVSPMVIYAFSCSDFRKTVLSAV